MLNINDLINFVLAKGFNTVAIGYDGLPLSFKNKNFIEANLLSYGIDIIDLDSITVSFMSNVIHTTDADFGIFIASFNSEPDLFLITKEGKIVKEIGSISANKNLKEWNEVGKIYKFDYSPIIIKEVKRIFEIGFKGRKINRNIVLNMSFSPSSKIFPYILRDYFSKLTTLNATEDFNIPENKSSDSKTTELLFESYNADLGIEIDRNCEFLKVITKEGCLNSKDIFKYSLKSLNILGLKLSRLAIINELKVEENLGYEIINLSSPLEIDLRKNDLVFDAKRNTFIFPYFSCWFDSMITFLMFTLGSFYG
jgi:Phosphomannomutase